MSSTLSQHMRESLALIIPVWFAPDLPAQRMRELLDGPAASGVLPKEKFAEALGYLRNQWDALQVYLGDGRLPIGRVEVWRGGLGFGLLPCQGFPVRGAISACHAPFPHPAHRTGRADFPHPALLQNFRSSRSARLRGWWAVDTAPTSHTSRRQDTVCIPCRDAVHAA